MWQEEDVSQHNNVRILSAVWHDAEITICNPLSNESNETEIFRYIFEYQMLRVSSEMFKVSSDHVASLCSSSRCLGVVLLPPTLVWGSQSVLTLLTFRVWLFRCSAVLSSAGSGPSALGPQPHPSPSRLLWRLLSRPAVREFKLINNWRLYYEEFRG